ncbi:hypothetical protein Q4F19_12910 [Sphingomonas sp. BIUV-7]|uniref:Uncharacterized protein n=1 Tax=Sphingomonas natans TaxID=3063330 RepID=A0ABT8YAD1_9SPHN|nr:hypothetical protein [Sphingomonas sp. BIUV-7]MDO6415286.1 hypothetical protein [Sphingomonas sp. BIUV-7]
MAMLVKEAVAQLYASLGGPADMALEGLVAGAENCQIASIAACTVPSMNVLKAAAATGANLILCDGHPFHLYDAVWSTQISKPEIVLNAPATVAKRAFIAEHGINIVRIRSAWESRHPLSASLAFASQLHLGSPEPRADHVVCSVPGTTSLALAASLVPRGFNGLRVVGAPTTRATRIGVKAGMLAPATLAGILRDPTIDMVIAGDAIEWEATPYMEDVVATGRSAALMLAGFDASMAPLGAHVAAWARTIFPDYPVLWLSQPDLVRDAA